MPTWIEQLPQALRTDANLEIFNKFETIGDFAKSFVENNQSLSALTGEKTTLEGKNQQLVEQMGKMFNIPTSETSPEDLKKFRTALGVPDEASAYGLDEETGKTFLDLGFTVEQAKGFMDKVKATSEAEALKRQNETQEALKKFNEGLGDKKDVTYKLAEDALTHFYGADDLETVKKSVFSSPQQIEVNAKIGSLLKERPGIFALNNNNQGNATLYESMEGLD